VVSFSHGSSTPVTNALWAAERDKASWGGYWPGERPPTMFKPVTLAPDLARFMFDPRYRVPLYETVLHDSVISLDRWELSLYKLPEQRETRILLAMLYNTPLNFVLDKRTLTEHGAEMAELYRYFTFLRDAAGTAPMTGFRWLTADHLVQRTTFGDQALTVTANFGATTHDGVPGGCVAATTPGLASPRVLCPRDEAVAASGSWLPVPGVVLVLLVSLVAGAWWVRARARRRA
jgi:glycosyl hydrolase family 129